MLHSWFFPALFSCCTDYLLYLVAFEINLKLGSAFSTLLKLLGIAAYGTLKYQANYWIILHNVVRVHCILSDTWHHLPSQLNTCTNFQQSLVAVNIELGHTARVLQHVTKEGFTHEWSVWVRGENDRSLADVVEKVVFNLHESFKRPKRSEYLSFMICNAFYFPAV